MQVLQPEQWARPKGYANGIAAQGRQIYLSGMIGWNAQGVLVSNDFLAQARQALLNIVELLRAADAGPEHLVRLTWYLVDREEYLAAARDLGAVYREVIGRHYPAMSAVQVMALMEAGARVEIEATAVVPA